MATQRINNVARRINEQSVQIYNVRGMWSSTGQIAICIDGSGHFILTDDPSVLEAVRRCVTEDAANNVANRIAMVLLSPYAAVCLYLEGVFGMAELIRASQGPGYTDIHKYVFDGQELTLRILESPEHSVATADSDGRVI